MSPYKEEKQGKARSESRDSSLSYSPINRNPERYAHLTDDREKRRNKDKKEKSKAKEKAKVMPRVRLRSSSSEDDVELPPEPQKLSPATRDSEVRALQLLRAKAKESLEKKIPAKLQKLPSPKSAESAEAEKQKTNQIAESAEVINKPPPVKENETEPVVQGAELPPLKVEDIAIPDVPPLPPVTPPLSSKQPRSRDSSSSDSDR